MLPHFDTSGNLPPGIHTASWRAFASRYGTTPQRRALLEGLRRALEALRKAGCTTAYVNGSFVTGREVPADFDACWEVASVDLKGLDAVLLTFDNKRAAQKAKYLGELFPADARADQVGRTFLEFFQIDKDTGLPKGIVKINLRRLP